MRAPALLALLPLALLSCADEGEPTLGETDPCVLPQAPLLGCPPPQVSLEEPTIEEACQKLIQCEIYPIDDGPDGDQDYVGCLERLHDNPPDRLLYSLRCIEVSTCIDLREGFDGPCFIFGREP